MPYSVLKQCSRLGFLLELATIYIDGLYLNITISLQQTLELVINMSVAAALISALWHTVHKFVDAVIAHDVPFFRQILS